MSSLINKQTLEHLANLARIELDRREEEKLLRDLQKILEHFQELQELDTSKVEPLAGGTELTSAFREDAGRENTNQRSGTEELPEVHDGFLKIPPVFE
jgi:aspartyl-tRNA(Asn)/glutamyl-tRNA(Gln) amidotransferase subunit C